MGSVVVAPRFKSTASVVVAHRLSCSVACGIFPNQGWNLCSLHGQADYLPLSHQRSSKNFDYNFCILFKKLLSVYSRDREEDTFRRYLSYRTGGSLLRE